MSMPSEHFVMKKERIIPFALELQGEHFMACSYSGRFLLFPEVCLGQKENSSPRK